MAKNSKPDMRKTVDVDLDFPITVDGRDISVITMRRSKIGDTINAKNMKGLDDMERGLALIANLCSAGGIPLAPEHLHELDELDADKLQAQYDSFRGGGA